MAPGNYTLTETVTPPGFTQNLDVYYVHVSTDGTVTIRLNDPVNGPIHPHYIPAGNGVPEQPWMIVANYPKGSVTIKKIDSSGVIIPGNGANIGAQFTLTGNPPLVYQVTKTVNAQGTVTFDSLEKGTYKLQETRTPEGYTGDPKIYTVIVTADGKVTIRLGE